MCLKASIRHSLPPALLCTWLSFPFSHPLRLVSHAPGSLKSQQKKASAFVAREAEAFAGYDVYVLGENNASKTVQGYWKNNRWTPLSAGGSINDLFVEKNGQVFLAGNREEAMNNQQFSRACYWQDSTAMPLETDPGFHSDAVTIAADKGDVFSGGYEYDKAPGSTAGYNNSYCLNVQGIVWKNQSILYRFPDLKIVKVRVIKDDVYTAGTLLKTGARYSVVYKNDKKWIEDRLAGEIPALFDMDASGFVIAKDLAVHWYRARSLNASWQLKVGNGFEPGATCITTDHKVLIAGSLQLFDPARSRFGYYAGVWHNGQFDRLETRYESRLTDIREIDGTQFILGNMLLPNTSPGSEQPVLWINARKYRLYMPGNACRAKKLFVRKK